MRGLEGVAIMFAVIFALGMILVFVLFLLNLQNALKEVSEKKQRSATSECMANVYSTFQYNLPVYFIS